MCLCTTKRSCAYLSLLCLCECSELPGEGYAVLKGISSVDQMTTEQPVVDELKHSSGQDQAELIADQFVAIQNEYQDLENDDVCIHL